MNHLAVFDSNYLELSGFDPRKELLRPELKQYPEGLNSLVFATPNAAELQSDLRSRGVDVTPMSEHLRPVEVDGRQVEAHFRVFRLNRSGGNVVRVYFCEHRTPELVWRPDRQAHQNTTLTIARVLLVASDVPKMAQLFATMFGPDVVEHGSSTESQRVHLQNTRIDIMTTDLARFEMAGVMPDPKDRSDFMAAVTFEVESFSVAENRIRRPTVDATTSERRILVPAACAHNAVLEFVPRR
jgi:hypothetical protein